MAAVALIMTCRSEVSAQQVIMHMVQGLPGQPSNHLQTEVSK